MYNKRLLLLGITVIGSGWMYPTNVNYSPQDQCLADTERVATTNNSLPGVASSNSAENTLSQELFMAAYVGGSNGVRLNPKALGFIQDYLQENWDELQKVNHDVDERKTYYKSTRAAAAYLRDLYNELGDWLLVIAAYNTGTVNVYRAIHHSGSRNFWDLEKYLPAESRSHVKKFIGTQYMFEGQGGVTTLTRQEATEQLSGSAMYVFHRDLTAQELTQSRTIAVSGKYHSSVITKYILMDTAAFDRYNPHLDKVMASSNNIYDLKLPADKMDLFIANKYDILNESAQLLNNGDSVESARGVALNK